MGEVRNGSKVKVIDAGSTHNQVGDVGIVQDYCHDDSFRVHVDGKANRVNWMGIEEVQVLEY